MLQRMNSITLCLVILSAISVFESAQLAGQDQPNIVLLFADDAGYADFGFQGSREMRTPNLDRLASEGILCTNAYMTACVCGPTRAGLITGRYQQRFGCEENPVPPAMDPAGLQGPDMGLPLNQKTMADYLKDLGYRSIALGKWHLGGTDLYHPMRRGFDEFLGFRGGSRSYWAYKETPADPMKKLERGIGNFEEHEGYLTDVLADEACRFIRDNKDRPFFVYMAFNAPHTPMEAPQEDLAQFPNLDRKRKTYAAMTLALDRACGRVLQTLEELNLAENTLVVFTNDNGGPSFVNASINDPLSGVKATHLEGGIRVPFVIKWPEKLTAGSEYHQPVSALDLLPTFIKAAGGDVGALHEPDGVSLIPYLMGDNPGRPHQTLYWKKESRAAIRDMDWKLIRLPDRPAELYNLSSDIAEQHDMSAVYPEKVEELYKKLWVWEVELVRPIWQLRRSYEKQDMERFDAYRK
jgi:arylsulfatase A-like enzyme